MWISVRILFRVYRRDIGAIWPVAFFFIYIFFLIGAHTESIIMYCIVWICTIAISFYVQRNTHRHTDMLFPIVHIELCLSIDAVGVVVVVRPTSSSLIYCMRTSQNRIDVNRMPIVHAEYQSFVDVVIIILPVFFFLAFCVNQEIFRVAAEWPNSRFKIHNTTNWRILQIYFSRKLWDLPFTYFFIFWKALCENVDKRQQMTAVFKKKKQTNWIYR